MLFYHNGTHTHTHNNNYKWWCLWRLRCKKICVVFCEMKTFRQMHNANREFSCNFWRFTHWMTDLNENCMKKWKVDGINDEGWEIFLNNFYEKKETSFKNFKIQNFVKKFKVSLNFFYNFRLKKIKSSSKIQNFPQIF